MLAWFVKKSLWLMLVVLLGKVVPRDLGIDIDLWCIHFLAMFLRLEIFFLSFLAILCRETRCSLASPKVTCKCVPHCGEDLFSFAVLLGASPTCWLKPVILCWNYSHSTCTIPIPSLCYKIMKFRGQCALCYLSVFKLFPNVPHGIPVLCSIRDPLHSQEREIKL